MNFTGTKNYIATKSLQTAVNAALHLKRPLLIKGEPGTGKTMLAHEISQALEVPLHTWHIKSTSMARQGLYEYDAVSRLRDSQLGSDRVNNIANYIEKGVLWKAFDSTGDCIVLIDEIDKADIEFPNDLLLELDKMEFDCYELGKTIKAVHRPLIIITSNNEKELPDPFLRRCFFHFIEFPSAEVLKEIVLVHFPEIKQTLMNNSIRVFLDIRAKGVLKKNPSTSELIDWLKLLMLGGITESDLESVDIRRNSPPYLGALIKNEADMEKFVTTH